MSGHPSPLMVDSHDGFRIATDDELALYKKNDPKGYKKWSTHNRVMYGRALIKSGKNSSEAWRDAFTRYPNDDDSFSKKHKFVMTL